MNTLDKEIQQAGGPQALSKQLGITIQRLVNWRSRGRVPADMVLTFCRARSWQVTPHELRPDIYPNSGDGIPADQLHKLTAYESIRPILSPEYTQISEGECMYSLSEQERRANERRNLERRDLERRNRERRNDERRDGERREAS